MKKLLLLLMTVFGFGFAQAQINENFESGTATLNWTGFDGTWRGVVNNPKPNKVNSSTKCGSYIKKDSTAYSLFGAPFTTPLNLTTNNKFKIQVLANKTGTFIFKLEGPKGAKEVSKQIVVTGAWQEYTIDLYGARAIDSLVKLFIFFDAGVGNSKKDTFWIDNIQQLPADACSGTVPLKRVIDDFECQRNANYTNGWDSITVVANPDRTGINTSATVGKYIDPVGEPYGNVLHNNVDPLDLSQYNYLRVKVYAPKAGLMLLKLENGGAAIEVGVPITAAQVNKWVEVGADFSARAFVPLKSVVLFFNAGVDAVAGDVYYFDDLQFTEKPALEDFEPQKLTWAPLSNNVALHGIFTAVANPNVNNVLNNSGNAGKYTKGTAAISTLTGSLPIGFKLDSITPQMNLQVYAPAGSVGKTVRLQLVSATQGNKEATATIDSAGTWTELKFDFSAAVGILDIGQINILFDPSAAANGAVYYYDNLKLSKLTLNPCIGVAPIPYFLDDFECQRNATYSSGGNLLTVVKNPAQGTANPSEKVGRYADPPDEYSAIVIDNGANAWDLSRYNQLSIKLLCPRNVPLLFKLEGGTSPGFESPIFNSTSAGAWVTYNIDFSGQKGKNHKKLTIFTNAGVANSGTDLYYLDDIQWKSEPVTGCAVDFETPVKWTYFAADSLDGKLLPTVANPKKAGINTSNNVGQFKRLPTALVFQGAFTDLGAPAKWTTAQITVRAKVLMDHIGNFGFKLEGAAGGQNGEIPIANTKVNEWEELTADFSSRFNGTEGFMRFTMFFDLGLPLATTIQTSYFDDIVIGVGTCGRVGIFDPIKVERLSVFPNPATNDISIRNTEGVSRFEITNMLGQRVSVVVVSGNFTENTLSLAGLERGMYVISAFTDKGLVGNAKFVKE